MKIALVSLNSVWEDKEANKVACIKYIERSLQHKAELIIFPEMTLTGFSMNIAKTAEDIENSESINWFKNQSKKFCINLAFGIVLKSGDKAKNYLYVVDRNGLVLADYAKIHPFSYSSENLFFDGGNELKNASINQMVIGLTICYDLRFPELYQALSKKCEVIVNIANWPQKRIDHWRTLLKARAIENQVFMIGVNRTGIDGNNIEYKASSTIFNPTGLELTPFHSTDGLDLYNIYSSEVLKIRASFPMKKDRRIEIYRSIL